MFLFLGLEKYVPTLLFKIKATLRLATHVFLYCTLQIAVCISACGANDLKIILKNFKTQNGTH